MEPKRLTSTDAHEGPQAPESRLDPIHCPECRCLAQGTVETLKGLAMLNAQPDGTFEYEGSTEVWWDAQETLHGPDGRVTLACPHGHEWQARLIDPGGEARALTQTVKYLIALESRRWDTVTVEVPLETTDRQALVAWAEEHLAGQAQYRGVVLWALYAVHPDSAEPGCRSPGLAQRFH